jgi:hypothetical protein
MLYNVKNRFPAAASYNKNNNFFWKPAFVIPVRAPCDTPFGVQNAVQQRV